METVYDLQNLIWLLSSPLQKMFADFWSKFKEYLLDLVPDIGNLCNDIYVLFQMMRQCCKYKKMHKEENAEKLLSGLRWDKVQSFSFIIVWGYNAWGYL